MVDRATADAIRKRPGMYVGDVDDGTGEANLVLELVANVVDLHLAGRCSRLAVDIAGDGAITVTDDGPGIASPALCCETYKYTPTFDGHRPHVHVGFGGAGLFAVNALTERLEIATRRGGTAARAAYSRAELVEPWTFAPAAAPSGTAIRIRPDRAIFRPPIARAALDDQLDVLADLLPSLALGRPHDGRGLAGLVAVRAACAPGDVVHARATVELADGPIDVEIALAWRTGAAHVESFVNYERSRAGGRHVDGLLDGVRAARGADALDELVAAVHVVLADVTWGEPRKDRLVSDRVRAPVADVAARALRAR